jgi:hypothetical protein
VSEAYATPAQAPAQKEPDSFTINRVRPGVEGMVGVVEKGKSDPRAYPRNPPTRDASEVATDACATSPTSTAGTVKLKAFRNILVEGTAAVLTRSTPSSR